MNAPSPSASDQAFQRVLDSEGVGNLRDYGGYPTRDGRRVKRGVLFRSAHHGAATERDLQTLSRLGCVTVVDLRRRSERERDPSRRHPEFTAQVIDNDIGDVGTAPHLTFLAEADLTPQTITGFMVREYERMPFEARHLDLYSRYFAALAEGAAPVLIHCAAGKDRTGILAALTHHVLGVSDEDAMADYLLTNTAGHHARRAPEVAANLAANFGRSFPIETVKSFMGVQPVYLHTAWRVIGERYGSVDGYLEQALGVDAARRERIVAALVE